MGHSRARHEIVPKDLSRLACPSTGPGNEEFFGQGAQLAARMANQKGRKGTGSRSPLRTL
jgi:hypothetical protein